jgi:hypothetical protein
MAVAVEVTFVGEGATLESYYEAIKALGASPEGKHPDPGCLFHWVTTIEGGYRVTDVWREKSAFETFISERVGPAMQQLGAPQPQVRFIDVENFLTTG